MHAHTILADGLVGTRSICHLRIARVHTSCERILSTHARTGFRGPHTYTALGTTGSERRRAAAEQQPARRRSSNQCADEGFVDFHVTISSMRLVCVILLVLAGSAGYESAG